MAYDIYGNNLRAGFCEVHPHVQQSYPCQLCYAETSRQDDQVDDRVQKEPNQLEQENASLREEIERLKKEREWIPVEKNLPLVPMFVIAYRERGASPPVIGLYFDSNKRFRYGQNDHTDYVTHWQPLPPKP